MRRVNWLLPRKLPRTPYRPSLQALEDRTVPSAMSLFFGGAIGGPAFGGSSGTAGPATHLQVVVPESARAGHSAYVLVEALDASNHLATGYTGSVALSLDPADAGVTLPTAYTFKASDHGVHVFTVSLQTAGSETIDATGTLGADTITGAATTTVFTTTPPTITQTPTQVLVITPEQAATGVNTRVEVEILDAAGHLVRNFTGAVTISSTDTSATGAPNHRTAQAALPITYTFTRWDGGDHTFVLNFSNAAAAGSTTTVSASTPGGAGTLTGQATLTTYPPTVVTQFAVFSTGLALSGNTTSVVVAALNASGRVVPSYTGTVSFSSTDTAATISDTSSGTQTALTSFTYPFVAGDKGVHRFFVTFGTTGSQTLTATDSANNLSGKTSVFVITPPAPRHHHWWWF